MRCQTAMLCMALFTVLVGSAWANQPPEIVTGSLAFDRQIIHSGADETHSVVTADLDDDGDMDAASTDYVAGAVYWYENDGNDNFTVHVLDGDLGGAYPSHVADLDQDGDPDILACGYLADVIVWYENDGAAGFTRHDIDVAANGAHSVVDEDMDGDGDVDLLTAHQDSGKVAWYENDGEENFTRHMLTNSPRGAKRAEFADFDGDEDWDIVAAGNYDNEIIWYENDGSENFTFHLIDSTALGAYYVYPADVDDDGDVDILSASQWDNTIGLYLNDGNGNFTIGAIDTDALGARSIIAVDMDRDGDLDAVGATPDDDRVSWYENDGSGSFTKQTLHGSTDGAYGVWATDFEHDGDMDVLSAARDGDTVTIHRQFRAHRAELQTTGGTLPLGPSQLRTADADDGPAELTYTVTEGPVAGDLKLGGQTVAPGGSFTQEDVDSGRLAYIHDAGGSAVDGFTFTVSDGGEGGWNPATGVFTIDILGGEPGSGRVTDDLLVLYGFTEGSGAQVMDVGGVGEPLDLTVADPDRATWDPDGGLTLGQETIVATAGPATKIHDAVTTSNALTVEAWVAAANTGQSGPARIVTCSLNSTNRNFTLGQNLDRWDFRLRTTSTTNNGIPSLDTDAGTVTTDLHHLVYTRDAQGQARLYVDGEQLASRTVGGDLSGWNASYALALGNELTGGRPWLGTYRLVGIYAAALSAAEVQQNFAAGPTLGPQTFPPPEITQQPTDQTVAVGQSATFSVTATGPGTLQYQWQIHGTDIAGATSASYSTGPVELADSGNAYRCVVSNAYGSVTSEVAVLTVIEGNARVTDDLLVLYGFTEGGGDQVMDVGGVGEPLDLTVADPDRATWDPDGGLTLGQETIVATAGPATKVHDAVTASNALTVEAWVAAASTGQSGPARIVTCSMNSTKRNFTLGQILDSWDFRLRTTSTTKNGRPSLSTDPGTATTDLHHLAYTRDAQGQARLYVDGELVASRTVGGELSGWNASFPLALGNELTGDRPWLGTYRLVGIYAAALSAAEVQQNFTAGPTLGPPAAAPPEITQQPADQTVLAGETATFTVTATGPGTLQYQWQIDGGDIAGAISASYTTGPVELADSGNAYRCVVSNAYGSVTSEVAVLTVIEGNTRVTDDLVLLYKFDNGLGTVVSDISGVGTPLDLTITDSDAVSWIDGGGLSIDGPTLISSLAPATKLIDAVQATDEITIEVWTRAGNLDQTGPARLVTCSDGPYRRNFTLGQGSSSTVTTNYQVRFRTTSSSLNGNPYLNSPAGTVTEDRAHVVYTRKASGQSKLCVNGVEVASHIVTGDLSSWDNGFELALGNEIGGGRPWLGELHLVAFYSRALTAAEIQQNFQAGLVPGATGPYTLAADVLGGGQILLDPPGGVYPAGTSVQLSAVPNPDHLFNGWWGSLHGATNPGTLIMNGDKTVNASFAALELSDSIDFALFGDFGTDDYREASVAELVASFGVSFIVTTGDNSYDSTPIDDNIGKYYGSYIGDYQGSYGEGSPINRFFPSLGNHDLVDGGGLPAYLDYFDLPGAGIPTTATSGNERYYDFVRGPVHFFCLNSNPAEQDGNSAGSTQADWLQAELEQSSSPWKIVFLHHTPFSSGALHGSTSWAQWPFEEWGATAVCAGHDHLYERVMRDDNNDGLPLPYFTVGTGGRDLYGFEEPIPGSEVRYGNNTEPGNEHGAMIVSASATQITFAFHSVEPTHGTNGLIDTFTLDIGAEVAAAREVGSGAGELPRRFAASAYPNPFNPETTLAYSLVVSGPVQFRILDAQGRLVKTLLDEFQAAGSYELRWDGRGDRGQSLASGVYFGQVVSGGQGQVVKLGLVK